MKKIIMMLVAVLMSTTAALAQVDKIVGEWKTVDDETGKTLSVVKIYKQNNLYYGKIIKLFAADANEDGEISTDDARYILCWAVGISTDTLY